MAWYIIYQPITPQFFNLRPRPFSRIPDSNVFLLDISPGMSNRHLQPNMSQTISGIAPQTCSTWQPFPAQVTSSFFHLLRPKTGAILDSLHHPGTTLTSDSHYCSPGPSHRPSHPDHCNSFLMICFHPCLLTVYSQHGSQTDHLKHKLDVNLLLKTIVSSSHKHKNQSPYLLLTQRPMSLCHLNPLSSPPSPLLQQGWLLLLFWHARHIPVLRHLQTVSSFWNTLPLDIHMAKSL